MHPKLLELFKAPDVLPVVLGDVMEADAGMRRFGVPALRHRGHAALVPAAVADHEDVGEPAGREAPRHVSEDHLEGLLGEAEGPREPHMPGGRVVVPLGHELDDGCDQRAAQPPGDRFRGCPKHHVVLPGDHVGTVLLDAAGGDDRSGCAVGDPVANLHPGELFNEDAVERRDGPLGVERVPGMILGLAAATKRCH